MTKLTFLLTEASLSELLQKDTVLRVRDPSPGKADAGREGRGQVSHSPLPQDAKDGGFHVVYTAGWGCLLLVSEKVWS